MKLRLCTPLFLTGIWGRMGARHPLGAAAVTRLCVRNCCCARACVHVPEPFPSVFRAWRGLSVRRARTGSTLPARGPSGARPRQTCPGRQAAKTPRKDTNNAKSNATHRKSSGGSSNNKAEAGERSSPATKAFRRQRASCARGVGVCVCVSLWAVELHAVVRPLLLTGTHPANMRPINVGSIRW